MTRSPLPGRGRARAVLLAALAALGLGLAGAPGAQAAPDDGWARVAHLSPDTAGVDVRLSGLAGGGVLHRLDGVSYGQVSGYLPLPAGTYVVSMVPAGADEGTTPVVTQTLTVEPGKPLTVAAYGRNSALTTTVYSDDLTSPPDGQARVRVVQASTRAGSVDVSTTTGVAIARGATTGAATAYATVPAGAWDLALGGDASGTARVDLAGGSVSTLLVLDDAAGRQTVKPVLDAAGPAATPQQGVDTGGGGLAPADRAATPGTEGAVGLGLGLGLVGVLVAVVAAARARGRSPLPVARSRAGRR
ncbi:DUF4397 domain-containing protein [Cellulomonas endophytica]|uniref:DUF4397 domain-containing protein n=1 Tax=Cellulomonas endophytica TaxID=2494735 RepID=UPI001011212F|nr:DUF4397 domain-containing protein [Cellulomonas endophytica]